MLMIILKVTKKTWLHTLTGKHMFEKTIGEGNQIEPPAFLGLNSKSAVFQ